MKRQQLPAMELGTPGPQRERLLKLVKTGKKRATTGLLIDYSSSDWHVPFEGSRLQVIDSYDEVVGWAIITKVEQYPFGKVTDEIARAEGEGDLSLNYWKESHREFFEKMTDDIRKRSKDSHWTFSENTLVVTEFFDFIEETA